MRLREMWRRMTTSRYTRALEAGVARRDMELARERAEIRRLRAENRALLNSILGIAGIPPVIASEEDWAEAAPAADLRHAQNGVRTPTAAHPTATKQGSAREFADKQRAPGAHPAAPLRRRSWQQINRALEFASAQKSGPPEEDA